MSIANRLYDRPHGFVGDVNATNPADLPVLYVDGSLPNAIAKYAYEGRLQIHNAVGSCKVNLVSGNLPAGYTISVDNITSEVVIKWPPYETGVISIPNANFEAGDDGSWELGPGFTIESEGTSPDPNDPSSTKQLQFANLNADPDGPDTMSNFYAPVADARAAGQTSITASVDVQQGASSANQAGAAVRVLFYDSVGFKLPDGKDGNVIKSGSDSSWQTSTVNAPIPPDAAYARVGAVAYRKGQNRALWIDNVKWNLQQPSQGVDSAQTIPLSLEVQDAEKRVADWSGNIIVNPFAVAGRMYRIWITDNEDSGDGAFMNLSLIGLHEISGGPNICPGAGGTVTQSSVLPGEPNLSAAAAFNNPNTDGTRIDGTLTGYYWHSGNQTPYTTNQWDGKTPQNPWWATYDFGVGVTKYISEIALCYTNYNGRFPVSFEVQVSNDGTNWTTVKSFTGISTGWAINTVRLFSII